MHSAEARPEEQSDGYVRRIRARLQKLERNLAEVAKIVIGDNVRRVQQTKQIERGEVERAGLREDVEAAIHGLAAADSQINTLTDAVDLLLALNNLPPLPKPDDES